MGVEIERKFLVQGDFKAFATSQRHIVQGYLSLAPERNVRVRIVDEAGWLTIKGATSLDGLARFEWEQEIPLLDARALLQCCIPELIEKMRYLVPEKNGMLFEVDEFFGANQGLIVAELEMPTADYVFDKPQWLGEEVTGEARYYNASLVKKPYATW